MVAGGTRRQGKGGCEDHVEEAKNERMKIDERTAHTFLISSGHEIGSNSNRQERSERGNLDPFRGIVYVHPFIPVSSVNNKLIGTYLQVVPELLLLMCARTRRTTRV